MVWARSSSISARRRSSQAMWVRIPRCTGGSALSSRFFSAVHISMSWRRRVRSALSACVYASGSGRKAGRTASANCASTAASRVSVLASLPVALAKSRTWRGLTTTTGSPAAASSPVRGSSSPPVASSTIRVGAWRRRRATSGQCRHPGSRRPSGRSSAGARHPGDPSRRQCLRRLG